jgi:hypothetical protein
MTASDLLEQFVNTFGSFDDLQTVQTVQAVKTVVPRAALEQDLGGLLRGRRLPPLYEQLVLSYRWDEVDLGRVRLLANAPPGLQGLAEAIRRDQGLYEVLDAAGYLQFGKGPDVDYDPVCFDLGTRRSDGDCRIVKFDHEQILCNHRLVEVSELAPSFRRLIQDITGL